MPDSASNEELARRLLALCLQTDELCLALRQAVAECADRCPGVTDAEWSELRGAMARALEAVARTEQANRATAGCVAVHLKR
jgi:hypothetical protein